MKTKGNTCISKERSQFSKQAQQNFCLSKFPGHVPMWGELKNYLQHRKEKYCKRLPLGIEEPQSSTQCNTETTQVLPSKGVWGQDEKGAFAQYGPRWHPVPCHPAPLSEPCQVTVQFWRAGYPPVKWVTQWHCPCLTARWIWLWQRKPRSQQLITGLSITVLPSSLPALTCPWAASPACILRDDAAASTSPSWPSERASQWHDSLLSLVPLSLTPCQRLPDQTSIARNWADSKNLRLPECNSLWLAACVMWCPGEVLWRGRSVPGNDDALTLHRPLLMASYRSNSLK